MSSVLNIIQNVIIKLYHKAVLFCAYLYLFI